MVALSAPNQFILLCLFAVAATIGYWYLMEQTVMSHQHIDANPVMNVSKTMSNKKKLILIYSSFWGMKPWPYFRPDILENYTQRCGCNFTCKFTYDQNKIKYSDMLIFSGVGVDRANFKEIQKKRPPNQLWLHHIVESPYYTHPVASIEKYFNLSLSYRLNSDVRHPYRQHVRRNHAISLADVNYAKDKGRQIAWAVSNCGKARDKLAKKLHDYGLQIDNFGRCKLPFTNRRSFLRNEIRDHKIPPNQRAPYHEYKFVFAAENFFCKDYVTEKYWKHGFNANTIPIVLGGANYSDPKIAIPGSFIDALSFPSPKKLAEYLILLDKNDTLYNEYFKWRKYWKFYDEDHPRCPPYFVCDLCQKLHENNWKFRKNPLTSVISKENECKSREQFYNEWLKEH